MNSTILVGLGSKARIGKDYAAVELAKHFNLERRAFADTLKADLAEMLKKTANMDYWALEKIPSEKDKLRPLLVEYGMTMRRFDENYWVNRALSKNFYAQVTLITDVRFPNEAQRIKELGGYYIEIETKTAPANETEALYSPMMVGLADYTVKNNFDRNFIQDLSKLISNLDSTSDHLWKKNLSVKSKTTSSTVENTNSFMLGQNLSFQLKK